MNGRGAAGDAVAARIYRLLLHSYPATFRNEFGAELRETFLSCYRGRSRGAAGLISFWFAILVDLARSAPRQWVSAIREAGSPEKTATEPAPPYLLATLAGAAVFTLYVTTLAPSIGFWDSGEYTAVAHTLGIPHPPGSPLFVLLAHAWEIILAPTRLSSVVRINLFSAFLSAASHGLWFLVVDRVLRSRREAPWLRWSAAGAAVLLSGTAFTVWNQSNVNEKVYAISFFTTALVSWLILRWRDSGRSPRRLIVIAFILALTATNHLMGLLVAPALLAFVLLVDHRALLRPKLWLVALPVVAVGLSVHFYLPLRAAQDPIIAQGQPECETMTGAVQSVYSWGGSGCEPLSAVLSRGQYGKPSVLLDPTVYPQQEAPRELRQLASQLVNYLQYLDWQWGRGVAGAEPVFGGLRPLITLLFLSLGIIGARAQWRRDRISAIYLGTLFLTLSVGLVGYMNFRYGYALEWDRFPSPSMHEVRERDYFFLIGFSVWGLWAGIGLIALWSRLARWAAPRIGRPRLATSPLLAIGVLPLVLNWSWATRAEDFAARDFAYNVLMSVEPYGVLVTNGDNDTFPLWYLQEVEGIRRDVTVMVGQYLNTPWYVKQLRQLTEPCPPNVDPGATPTRIVCQRPFQLAQLPEPLVRAGWGESAETPSDSVFPLSDAEIDTIAAQYAITDRPMTLQVGEIRATVAEGTFLAPADTFIAAMLSATMGDRPIYFMPGASTVARLGLGEHTVRHGLTWRIAEQRERPGIVQMPEGPLSGVLGAAVDLPLTDTLLWDVYLRRGRLLDPAAPWVDAAAANIPAQYVYAHYAAGQAAELSGEVEAARRQLGRAEWWERVITN